MGGEERKGEERGHTLIRYQTLTLPKPLVEFGNKRMILHQVEALAAAGVTDIVLAVNYRPEIMEKYLAEVYIPILYISYLDVRAHFLTTETVRAEIQRQDHLLHRERTSRYRRPAEACRGHPR